nr:MAG TPA: hypothetical protein [Bacteriophage sp.]
MIFLHRDGRVEARGGSRPLRRCAPAPFRKGSQGDGLPRLLRSLAMTRSRAGNGCHLAMTRSRAEFYRGYGDAGDSDHYRKRQDGYLHRRGAAGRGTQLFRRLSQGCAGAGVARGRHRKGRAEGKNAALVVRKWFYT